MTSNPDFPAFKPVEGGCTCKTIRYRLLAPSMFTHCCHCRYCQRESGAAFALNAFLESTNVIHISSTEPELISTPTQSGVPQQMARCPKCHVCVWSYYGGGTLMRFMRVGTLDDPDLFAPDAHIFTSTKMPWVNLNGCGKIVAEEYYDKKEHWPKSSLERVERLKKATSKEGKRELKDKDVEDITNRTEDVKLEKA